MLAVTRPHDDNQCHVITVCAMRCLPPPMLTGVTALFLQPHDVGRQVGTVCSGAKGTYRLADYD